MSMLVIACQMICSLAGVTIRMRSGLPSFIYDVRYALRIMQCRRNAPNCADDAYVQ